MTKTFKLKLNDAEFGALERMARERGLGPKDVVVLLLKEERQREREDAKPQTDSRGRPILKLSA